MTPLKRAWALAAMLLAICGQSYAQEQEASPWLLTVSANHGAWNSDKASSDGSQTTGFVQMAYAVESWGLSVSGTYARTSYMTEGADGRFEVSTPADTDISTFYLVKLAGWTLRGGVDIKAPTGKHAYTDEEISRIMVDKLSQEIMLLNTYGGGLSVIPHFVAVYSMKPFTIGAAARYEITGEYDPTTQTGNDNFNPGDRITALLTGAWAVTDDDALMLTASYLSLGKDKQDGKDVFRQGDTYSADARYIRSWGEALSTSLGVIYRNQGINQALTAESYLQSEVSNSNNNSLETYLNGQYRYTKSLLLRGTAGMKIVGANGYPEDDPLYDAGIEKQYLEAGASWYFTEGMYTTALLRYTRIKNKMDALSSADTVYGLVNVDISFVYGF
ncbi:MAG: hypothetical protein HZB29_05175 [Nitrospinae bacterium]|nr:hypothetical protein [Nitrospinota bacterium]